MKSIRLKRLAAKRTFELVQENGTLSGRVELLISIPLRDKDSMDYKCHFQISGLSKPILRYAMGVDSAQALIGALTNAASMLYTCEEYKTGKLLYLTESNLGLPAFASAFQGVVPEPKHELVL